MTVLRHTIEVLALLEFLGLVVFVLMYLRSNWRSTDLGRNLMGWASILIVVYLVSALAGVWPTPWLGWTLAAAHGAFVFAVWHRVLLLRRYQSDGISTHRTGLFSRHASRPSETSAPPKEEQMSKARKAFMAASTAAGSALLAGLLTRVPATAEDWATLVGGAVAAGVVAGVAVYRIPNAGQTYR